MRHRQQGLVAGIAAATLTIVTGPALWSQDGGGVSAKFTFNQGLEWTDGDLIGTTDLGFGLSSRTRNQSLDLSVTGGFDETVQDGAGISFVDPALRLSYSVENRQNELAVSLGYRESDVSSEYEFDTDSFLSGYVLVDEGTLRDSSAGVSYTFGRETPISGTVSYSYRAYAFFDTLDPELIDRDVTTVSGNLRFRISERVSTNVFASRSETDRDGGTDVVSEQVGTGVQMAVTPNLDLSARISQTRLTSTLGSVSSVEEGLTYGINLSRAMPVGTLTASLDSDISEAGRRTTARINRGLEFKGSSLTFGVGATEGEDSKIRPLYSLAYKYALPSGELTAGIDQRVSLLNGDEVVNSQFRLGYEQKLNSRSSFVTSASLGNTNFLTPTGDDRTRVYLSLRYNYELTEDWSLYAGLSHEDVNRTVAVDTQTNKVFLGLRTELGWRP